MLIVKSYFFGEQSNDFTDTDARRMDSYLHIALESLQKAVGELQKIKAENKHVSSNEIREYIKQDLHTTIEYVRPFIEQLV